ncbi:MAG: DEAD/DEAH box helicase [Candidatus Thermoplasmatota archaeon]|nr:DEAD/DEAH box helicase [Candidatus Thermoplasmatota archaeon]
MDESFLTSAYHDYQGQITFSTTLPEKEPEYRESEGLSQHLKKILRTNDISLYSHQAETIDLFLKGNDVCLTTGTASGKTLAYALSIINLLHEKEDAKALLVFPTKALTRDQKKELQDIFALFSKNIEVGIYDGDVSSERKRNVRENADVVLTNFSGLNLYLSHHEKWSTFFEDLEAVIVDEAHHYRGLLGIHVAWIIRRLRRIARYYSKDPRFILTSATLGNPKQHSENLVGKKFEIIDQDGSERGKRNLLFWNPPKFHDKIDERKSTHRESSELMAFLVDKGLKTLMFAPSRKMTELDALWSREVLEEEFSNKKAKVKSYHAGHSKEERRKTEMEMRDGELNGVVSTTALELGINIGSIDVTLLSGYPGSRISFWQQIGRAGREAEEVLSILVPFNSALDQYIVKDPDHILGESIEDAVIDLSNNHVYSKHLLSAAQELPLREEDEDLLTQRLERAGEMWKKEGSLAGTLKSGYRYVRDDFPQQDIDLYSIGENTFEVQIREGDSVKSLPEVDKNRAYREFHPNAIYLHQGEYYKVVRFKEGPQPEVILERVDTDYYTETLRDTNISNIEMEEKRKVGEYEVCKGTGDVSIHYFAYRKKKLSDDDILSTESLGLDPVTINTQVSWFEIPDHIERKLLKTAEEKVNAGRWVESPEKSYMGGLHAAEHSLIHMLPLLMLIDEKDVGGVSTDFHQELGKPAIFIHDAVEEGVGFSHDAYSRFEELGKRSVKSLEECPCESLKGCPACTFSPDCGNDNEPLNKVLAIDLLEKLNRTIE